MFFHITKIRLFSFSVPLLFKNGMPLANALATHTFLQEPVAITIVEIQKWVKNMKIWTTAVLDMIYMFWLKKILAVHECQAA